jgi:hypothetical protein
MKTSSPVKHENKTKKKREELKVRDRKRDSILNETRQTGSNTYGLPTRYIMIIIKNM